MSRFSDDAKLIAAAAIHAGIPQVQGATPEVYAKRCWQHLGALIAAAPAGDTAQTAEPTEDEWSRAVGNTKWHDAFETVGLYCRAVSAEAHRLAALRGKA